MKEIQLTKGKVALVDDADFECLNQWKWHYIQGGYAVRTIKWNGKKKPLYMHRKIMDVLDGKDIDHINGDKLDNRRKNLRFVTCSQNFMNRRKTRGTSIFKGVAWDKGKKKWRAQITRDKNVIGLGRYESEQEAAAIYDQAAQQLFGEYAKLNSLEGVY